MRPGASTSRSLAEFLNHPSSRRNRQTNEGTNVERYYTRAGRSLGSQTGPLLDGPQRPRLEKPAVVFHPSDVLPIFQKATTVVTLPPIVPYQWRHSGPSIDIADDSRTLEQVKKTRTKESHENCPTTRETLPVRAKVWKPCQESDRISCVATNGSWLRCATTCTRLVFDLVAFAERPLRGSHRLRHSASL